MENSTPQTKSSMMPIAITAAIVVIILVGVIAFAMNNNSNNQAANDQQAIPTQAVGEAMQTQPTTAEAMTASYEDGEYSVEGMYTSPGGSESIDVTVTLENGVVTDAEVISNATRPTSKQMQASFIGGYKAQVIGKSLDEIELTKVSASSLTPKGFNDAIEKIKAQAKA